MNDAELLRLESLLRNASNAHVRLRLQQTARIDPAARLAYESIEAARKIVNKNLGIRKAASNSSDAGEPAVAPKLLGGIRRLKV
jgi:hypothetical protein